MSEEIRQQILQRPQECYPVESVPSEESRSQNAPFPATSEQGLWKQIRKAHEKMGHPHEEQFIRILRQAGASEYVLGLAKRLRCSVCEQHKPPKPPRISAGTPSFEFNAVVGLDVFHLQGWQNGQTVHVLNMVDWGTSFQICVRVKEVTAKKIRKAFRCNWVRIFGPPHRVVTDQGREFLGAEMAERLESDGTFHEIIPAESPWQNGKTERHGGIVKMIFTKARLSLPPRDIEDFDELLQEACHAKNRFSLKGGYSPTQRVFGTQLRVPGANFGDEHDYPSIGTMSGLEAGDQVLLRSLERRKAATEAYHFLDSASRLRKAVLSGPRSTSRYEAGDLVYFWRRDADVQAFRVERTHAHWHGPAVVLGHHRSKVWVSFRGHIWMCSPEQLRHTSMEENASQSEAVTELLEASQTLSHPQTPFQDVSQEIPEPDTSARMVHRSDVTHAGPPGREETPSDMPNVSRVPMTPVGPVQNVPRGRSPGPRSQQERSFERPYV